MIVLNDNHGNLDRLFERVEFMGESQPNPYALENEVPIYLCRGPRFGTLADVWPKLKRWR